MGNALYGLRGMGSDYKEVRALIAALTPKVASAREDLNGQALGNSLYGLQGENLDCFNQEILSDCSYQNTVIHFSLFFILSFSYSHYSIDTKIFPGVLLLPMNYSYLTYLR